MYKITVISCYFFVEPTTSLHQNTSYRIIMLRAKHNCTCIVSGIVSHRRRPQSHRLFSQQSIDTETKKQFDAYCFNSVRSADYESFLFGLMYPRKFREVFFALHAFNVEIATIQDQIPRNSIQAGRLRFQFWKDSFQQIYFGHGLSLSNNQPVAQALSHYIPQYNLTLRWFERSLEARLVLILVVLAQHTTGKAL